MPVEPKYPPLTPEEIALGDLLDAQDLASGRDWHGPALLDYEPTPHPPGTAEYLDVLEERARLGFVLKHPQDGRGVEETPAQERKRRKGRARRPSEKARSQAFRNADAARKREARRRQKDAC